MRENITVLGQIISYEIKELDIYSIEYYSANPRINYIISKYKKNEVTQEVIHRELLKLDSTRERIKDLEENKGLIDEIYILRNQVVEGNTRLCAFRWLCEKHPNDKHWKKIKARVLDNNVTEEQLFYILGVFHIKGKTEWDAYEKAAYIHKMINILKKSPEEICKQLRMQKKNVEATLEAYRVMSERYLPSSNKNDGDNKDELKKFSYFDAFFHQKELVERKDNTPDFLGNFVEWVKEGKFKNAQSVRDLPKILANRKAQKKFVESEPEVAFEEAKQILYEDRPGKVDKFYRKFEEFVNIIDEAEINKIKEEIASSKQKKHVIDKCYKKFKKFCKECGLDV